MQLRGGIGFILKRIILTYLIINPWFSYRLEQ